MPKLDNNISNQENPYTLANTLANVKSSSESLRNEDTAKTELNKNFEQEISDLSKAPENENFKVEEKTKKKSEGALAKFFNFLADKAVLWTTSVSAGLNVISAPLRAMPEQSMIKQFINKLSMWATRAHLFVYGLGGIKTSGIDNKNPLWLASFIMESWLGIDSKSKVDDVYLKRGYPTGLDIIPPGLEKYLQKQGHHGSKFKTWTEGFTLTGKAFMALFKDIPKNPSILWKKKDGHLMILSSLMVIIGSTVGLTVNRKVGSLTRDIGGMIGDLALYLKEKSFGMSGFFYLAGSIVDLIGSAMDKGAAQLLGISNSKIADGLHKGLKELALALDRIGQFWFLRGTQGRDSVSGGAAA